MKLPEFFMLIDDDIFSNILCKAVLKEIFANIDVVGFTEPEKGLEYIKNEYADNPVSAVLFLDINMPTLNGWEVMDIIAHYPESIKKNLTIFILSSSIDPLDKEKANENPLVSGYLEKPLSRKVLESLFFAN